MAGAAAGMTGQASTYPLDRARAVMAITKCSKYQNLALSFGTIVQKEGVSALYRGFLPTMVGIVPYAGTAFATNELIKNHLRRNSKLSKLQSFISGSLAGLSGQVVSYPIEVLRRRIQTSPQLGNEGYRSLLITLKNEGLIHGWFKGLSMNLIKGPISCGVCFMTYDFYKDFWRSVLISS